MGTESRTHGQVDSDFLIRTAAELVRIPSVNPALGDRGTGESAVADYVQRVLDGLGLDVARLEAEPGRPSVVGILRGRGGPSLMLNAHYDTVGVEGMKAPFSGDVKEGRLWGRGAYDMKGALAAGIASVKALVEAPEPPAGDVLVAAVADEETESLGIREVLASYRPDHAVVVEPSELRISPAHKGFLWIDVVTRGRAAHGSRPADGVDANLAMVRCLQGFTSYVDALKNREPHPLLGPPSAHVGRLEGGEGASTYAARCRAMVERRTIPGEDTEAVLQEITAALGAEAETRLVLARSPFESGSGSRVVAALERATEAVMGGPAPLVGTGPWTDASFLGEAGVDTVVFGPVGAGAHTAVEWVDVESLVTLARVLVRTADGLGDATPG